MKLGKEKGILFLAAGLIVLVLILGQLGVLPTFAITGDEIWCSEWIGIGCGIREEANKTAYLNTSEAQDRAFFTCNYDKGCTIETVTSASFTNCAEWAIEVGGVKIPELSGAIGTFPPKAQPTTTQARAALAGRTLVRGEALSTLCRPDYFRITHSGISNLNFSFTGKRLRLAYCSSGPTATSCDAGTSGVEILGADGCHYNVGMRPGATDPTVLNAQGNTIGSSQQSYPVPEGSNVWVPNPTKSYVCGTTQELCQFDTDCYHRYPFSWPLNAGLGNADIVGGQVVVYGCTAAGAEKCVSWSGVVEGLGTCLDIRRTNKCAIVQSNVYTAECNPLTSTCGPNAFCDPVDLRCKPTGTVQCSYERDPVCGTTVQCDRATMTMKEPYCKNPGTLNSACDFRVLQNVQCCGAPDCGAGYYCTADHTCEKQEPAIEECPWQCCEGDPQVTGYWPNVPAGMFCCPDHSGPVANVALCNPWRCQSDADCTKDQKCNLETGECEDARVCEDRPKDGIFVVGWKTVVTDTPTYLIPLPWGGGLVEIGRTTTEDCVEIFNWMLILAMIVTPVFLLLFFWIWRKTK